MLPATTPSIKPAACIILYTMALYGEVACTYLQPSFAGQGIGIMATGTTATAIGGLLLPFFLRVYRKGGILRLPLFAMLFLWPVLGFTPSAFLHRNVAMDYAMALGLGLLLPAVLAMFYQSIPSRQRGWWYGVGLACGLAWWQFIMLLEKTWPPDPGPGYNPWHIFAALFSATAALATACLCLSSPPFRRGTEDSAYPAYFSVKPAPDARSRLMYLLMGAGILAYFINGLLEVRLSPLAPVRPLPFSSPEFILFIVGCPLVGRFLDRAPDLRRRRLLGWCGNALLLVSPLVLLGDTPELDQALHAVASMAMYTLMLVLTTLFAGYARNAAEAGMLGGLVYGLKTVAFGVCWLCQPFLAGKPGVTAFLACAAAVAFYHLVHHPAVENPPSEAVSAPPPEPPPPPARATGPSWLGRALPYLPAIFFTLVLFSGRVSFGLRPRQDERMVPIMTFVLLGAGIGGWILPCFYAMFRQGWARWWTPGGVARMVPILIVLILPPLGSVFGYHVWLENESLRYFVNFGYGLALPAAYYVFFQFAPAGRRGWWLGFSYGLGFLLWPLLHKFAAGRPGEPWRSFPPGLFDVFIFHTLCVIALAVSLWKTLPLHPARQAGAFAPYFPAVPEASRRRSIILVFAALLVISLMNGFLNARLLPALVVAPRQMWAGALLLFAFALPLVGWWLDRDPVRSATFLLRGWGCVFILAPGLTILADDASIYTALYTVSVTGQLALFIIFAVVLTGLATNAAQAAALIGLVFALRITPMYWLQIAKALPEFDRGTSVVCATALAVLYYQLVVRIRLGGGVTTDAVTGPPPPMELPEALSPVQAEESKTSCMFELETKPEAALEPIYAMEPETFGQIAARIPVVPQVEQTIEAPVGELPMKSGVTRIERFLASVKLTEREHEIAVRILQGETSRSIAEDLGITGSTVNSHVLNIAEKFGVSNRKGLLVKYGCFD